MSATLKPARSRSCAALEETRRTPSKPDPVKSGDIIAAIRAGAQFEADVPLTRVEWATQRDNQFASVDGEPSADPDSCRSVEVSWEISEDRTYSSFEISGSAFSHRGGGRIPQGGYNFGEVAIEDLIALRDGLDDVLRRVIAGGLYVPPVDQNEAWRRLRARRGTPEAAEKLGASVADEIDPASSDTTVRRSGGPPWQITYQDDDEGDVAGPADRNRSKTECAPTRWSMGEAYATRAVRGTLRYGNDKENLGSQEEWLHASLTWDDRALTPDTTLFVDFPQLTQWDSVRASDFDAHVNLLVELRNNLVRTAGCTLRACEHDGEDDRRAAELLAGETCETGNGK